MDLQKVKEITTQVLSYVYLCYQPDRSLLVISIIIQSSRNINLIQKRCVQKTFRGVDQNYKKNCSAHDLHTTYFAIR